VQSDDTFRHEQILEKIGRTKKAQPMEEDVKVDCVGQNQDQVPHSTEANQEEEETYSMDTKIKETM
jgi:hypothetical protein